MAAKKTSEAKNTQSIDLLAIAASIETDSTKVHEIVEKTGKPVILLAKNLKAKYPELSALPDNLPLLRIRQHPSIPKVYICETIKVFKDDFMLVKAFDAELNALNYEIVKYKSGISGYAVIKADELLLIVGLSCSDDHRLSSLEIAQEFDHNEPFQDNYGNQFDVNGFVGEGTPPSEYVALVPRPEIPLYSPDLVERSVYEIIESGLKSRQYQTPLYNIKDSNGKLIKNVIGNGALNRIFEKNGVGAKFSIVQRFQKLDKDGNPIKSSGNNKDVWEVRIKDHQAVDLSDICIDIDGAGMYGQGQANQSNDNE